MTVIKFINIVSVLGEFDSAKTYGFGPKTEIMSTFFFHLGCLMFEFLFTVPIRLGKKVNVKYV